MATQRRLARQLESQLQTQSAEAIALSEKLVAIEDVLLQQEDWQVYVIEAVRKDDHPYLFWPIIGLWVGLGIWTL